MPNNTNREKTFDTVCEYALLKFNRREGPSRAKDLSHFYFKNPWDGDGAHHMVLFETDKHIARGHTEPEVYWVVIDETGRVRKMPARNIRRMTPIPGFAFLDGVWDAMFEILERNNEQIRSEESVVSQ